MRVHLSNFDNHLYILFHLISTLGIERIEAVELTKWSKLDWVAHACKIPSNVVGYDYNFLVEILVMRSACMRVLTV